MQTVFLIVHYINLVSDLGYYRREAERDNGRIGTEENRGFGIETLRATARIISNQGYAKFYRRSHDAMIRVYDETGNVIETHEHAGDFKQYLSRGILAFLRVRRSPRFNASTFQPNEANFRVTS